GACRPEGVAAPYTLPQEVAARIAEEAYNRGSGDNIGVVVLDVGAAAATAALDAPRAAAAGGVSDAAVAGAEAKGGLDEVGFCAGLGGGAEGLAGADLDGCGGVAGNASDDQLLRDEDEAGDREGQEGQEDEGEGQEEEEEQGEEEEGLGDERGPGRLEGQAGAGGLQRLLDADLGAAALALAEAEAGGAGRPAQPHGACVLLQHTAGASGGGGAGAGDAASLWPAGESLVPAAAAAADAPLGAGAGPGAALQVTGAPAAAAVVPGLGSGTAVVCRGSDHQYVLTVHLADAPALPSHVHVWPLAEGPAGIVG
ncbi:hypothetical protein MNEG_16621, partial [Monoraphidium neglectum]